MTKQINNPLPCRAARRERSFALFALAALVCVIVGLFGCAAPSATTSTASGSATKGKRPANFALEQAFEKRSALLTSLYADGNLTIEVGGKKQQAHFTGAVYKRDSILLNVTGPFNIAVAKVGSTPTFMNYYDVLTNTVYQGEPTAKNFQQRLGVPLSHDDIACFLRGEVPGGFSGFALESALNDSEDVFTRTKDTVSERLVYSHAAAAMTAFQRRNAKGDVLINAQFSNFFVSPANISIPRDALTLFPAINATFSVQCHLIEINMPNQKHNFVPPLEAKRRKL
jgi:hypothetical protein